MGFERTGGKPKGVVAYNRRKGYERAFPSMASCARTLDVDVSQVSRAVRSGNWVFTLMMPVKVRLAI